MRTNHAIRRRKLLAIVGFGGTVGIAGCAGDSNGDDDESDDDQSDGGESLEDGTIRIELLSGESSDPIPDADVTLSGESLDDDQSELTDDEGSVQFEDLDTGEYELEATAEGYESQEEDEIELDDEYDTSLDMTYVLQEEQEDEH